MDLPTIISFAIFAFVAAFTPGPNNIMLAASGANFGFRASLPHILGVCVGFCLLVVAAGFGFAGLFEAVPGLYDVLKIISILFLIYLAWKIVTAGEAEHKTGTVPLRLWQAATFQLVNPKGVSVIISAVTAYTSSAEAIWGEVTILLIVFFLVTLGSTCTWAYFGVFLRQFLKSPLRLRLFNTGMASLLLASLLPMLLG